MKPTSTARKQLRQSINASRSANGVRYLLAIWPGTWDWMERMNTHFHGLPMLTPGIDRVFDLEIHNVLYDIGHLGTALSNGTLKAAVRRRLLTSMAVCARTAVSTTTGKDHSDMWDWRATPFDAFAPIGGVIHMESRDPDIEGLRYVAGHILGADSELTDTDVHHLLIGKSTIFPAQEDAANG
ncbi:conserved protein of unknown function [Acidithiobacillus ferrivorans]|uniref:Uncharacterized protein n=1 Tax=Acidithiobacillus ferrivorans TaxID=160808 RepID=A0A060UZM8_9PROT|nr:hypothetical protein [Acidithiobacillus ferrivorans]CDQ12103.1 conserved hypothetical protein [Acidithiobacillus ferrivorans]SMH64769.1 conserved protein of unknown function [Acidithiobacillus ferrivorans]